MPRMARVVVDGGTYHVLTRGNNGQVVFHEDGDCQRYLQLLATYAKDHSLKIYHYALMPNHVHLVLETERSDGLSKAMARMNLAYALFYRRRHGYRGHLWQGRFKSLPVDRDTYLIECGRYVELNPVRAGLVKAPRDYAWSSYRAYAEGFDNSLITPNPLYLGLAATAAVRQQRYRQFVDDGLRPVTTPLLARYQFDGIGIPVPQRPRGRPRKIIGGFPVEKRSVPN